MDKLPKIKKQPKGKKKVFGIKKHHPQYPELDLAVKLENEMKKYFERYAVFSHRKSNLGSSWSQYFQYSNKDRAIEEAKKAVKKFKNINGAVVLDRKKNKIIKKIERNSFTDGLVF